MARTVAAAVVAALVFAACASAAPRSTASYSFGRVGGSIIPFTVTISKTGAVSVSGPAQVSKQQLSAAAETRLDSVVRAARFTALPATTRCAGTLPDEASLFVTAQSHRVLVHGDCSARFTRVYKALAAAVGLR